MPPVPKRCCVPHCTNMQEISKKQFFKIGANLESRNKWRVGKAVAPKSQMLHCCEDHFDLPNDATNYIRYKYCPGTKLKLRPNKLPHKKLPVNVCRLCLNLIFNKDDLIDISEKNRSENAKILATLLPEIDLSLTVEPVICRKCFDPLEKYYKLKQNVLRSEVVVVHCIKSIVKRSPRRLIKSCEIDLFDEYNEIKELLGKEKEKAKLLQDQQAISNNLEMMGQQESERNEEIVIQVEGQEEAKYHIVEVIETKNNYNMEEQDDYPADDTIESISGLNASNSTGENNSTDMQYEIIQESAEPASENVYIHME